MFQVLFRGEFGDTEPQKRRTIRTAKVIQGSLKTATARECLWIWVGRGLGFWDDDPAWAILLIPSVRRTRSARESAEVSDNGGGDEVNQVAVIRFPFRLEFERMPGLLVPRNA